MISSEKVQTILFDLDGTLLPMDQDLFIKTYQEELVKAMLKHGCNGEELVRVLWSGTKAMMTNNGTRTNREAFFQVFAEESTMDMNIYEPLFEAFYQNEFHV
ncbi:HAD family hydrolase, partial [Lachnospiraceae bacterium OttesenSCG-928-D06]|nr:HAD family hydrolase [Lachnospiraceae bacterium OttesenSCG-928-D06]